MGHLRTYNSLNHLYLLTGRFEAVGEIFLKNLYSLATQVSQGRCLSELHSYGFLEIVSMISQRYLNLVPFWALGAFGLNHQT